MVWMTSITQFGGIFQTDVTQDDGFGRDEGHLNFPRRILTLMGKSMISGLHVRSNRSCSPFCSIDFDTNDDADIFVDTGSGFTQIADESTSGPFVFSVGRLAIAYQSGPTEGTTASA